MPLENVCGHPRKVETILQVIKRAETKESNADVEHDSAEEEEKSIVSGKKLCFPQLRRFEWN